MLLRTTLLRHDRRGVSNVIVVMLSLVLIAIVVSNVILWSYQMNELDLERMQEKINVSNVTRVTRSPWSTPITDYTIAAGSKIGGSYTLTKTLDNVGERFREERTQIFNPASYTPNGATRLVSGNISDLTSNDGNYMSFRSYPNYEFRYQENLGNSSTTSTTYQDKVSIIFSPQVTTDFVIIATAEVQGYDASYLTNAQLIINSTTCQELKYRARDVTDWYPFSALKRLSLTQNSNYVVKVQFCTSDSRSTAYIRNARIALLSLQSEYAESETLSTTGSTSWQDKIALSFTPQSDGDYLLVATANYRMSSTSRNANVRLIQDDLIVHSDNTVRPGSSTTNEYYSFGMMRKVTLNMTLHSFKIQYCSSGSPGIAGISYAHITAIRLNQFDGNNYAESENESSPAASNVWYDKVVNAYSSQNGDYLILGSISYKSGSTSNSVALDFQTDSLSKESPLIRHRSSNDYETGFFMTKQTLTSGSRTDKIRWMGRSTSARVRNARLISCELPNFTQTTDVEFAGNSNVQNWTQLDWTMDSSFTTANVSTTFQLFDYQSNQYPTSAEGFMSDVLGTTDVTESQTITANVTRFRDVDGKWKTRIRGTKATDTQFDLRVDLAAFTVTTSETYRLCLNNDFKMDLNAYPLSYIRGIEILIRYNTTVDSEKWFLRAFNWSSSDFEVLDIQGNQPIANQWNDYAANVTNQWEDYVNSDGTIRLEFADQGNGTDQATIEIDFQGVRVMIDGTSVRLKNSGQYSAHIVAIWIINFTNHQRYSASLFINSGEETEYLRVDLNLPEGNFTTRVVTERGNIAVFP